MVELRLTESWLRMDDGIEIQTVVYEPLKKYREERIQEFVVLHGWPNQAYIWKLWARAVGDLGPVRIIAPTFRGFDGQWDLTADSFHGARFAADVIQVASALCQKPYALIGHSMGGKIAQRVAVQRPENMSHLILLCPATAQAAKVPEEKRASQRYPLKSSLQHFLDLFSGMTAEPLKPGEPQHSTLLSALIRDALLVSPRAWDAWIDVLREEDFRDELSKIAVPTLVLHGERDPLRTEAQLREQVVDRIPGAVFDTLPSVGHLPHLEDPETLSKRIRAFLSEGETTA